MMRAPTLQFSAHFDLGEFTRSATARKHQIPNQPRDECDIANLKALCHRVLEPVRALFGRPLIITSGYRVAALNRLLGSRATSQHLLGEAADFIIPGLDMAEVARTLALHPSLPFDQLIHERRDRATGDPALWIHISHRRLGPNRRERLSIHHGLHGPARITPCISPGIIIP